MLIERNGNYYQDGTQITAAEYAAALAEIKAKAAWVCKICTGSAAIEDVPEDWRTEISKRVADRQTQADDDPDLTAEEALDIILGGGANA